MAQILPAPAARQGSAMACRRVSDRLLRGAAVAGIGQEPRSVRRSGRSPAPAAQHRSRISAARRPGVRSGAAAARGRHLFEPVARPAPVAHFSGRGCRGPHRCAPWRGRHDGACLGGIGSPDGAARRRGFSAVPGPVVVVLQDFAVFGRGIRVFCSRSCASMPIYAWWEKIPPRQPNTDPVGVSDPSRGPLRESSPGHQCSHPTNINESLVQTCAYRLVRGGQSFSPRSAA